MVGALVYKPIPPDHIRLLKMLDAGNSDATIPPRYEFLTEHVDVAKYIAISYVWGQQAASKTISLDRRSFKVRQSLYAALTGLRKNTQRGAILWVDAICINQADDDERNSQVKMMDKIFSNAQHVLASLGVPEIQHIFVWRDRDAETVQSSEWELHDHVLDVGQRPYWRRMWIVQELKLARAVTFLVGEHLFSFDSLLDAVEYKQAASSLKEMMSHLNGRYPQYDAPVRSLYNLLLDFKDCESTDPRDRVFALLSLVPASERAILNTVFPDYTLRYDAVVMLTLSFVRTHHDEADLDAILDILKVSRLQGVRHRLLAISRTIELPYDADLVKNRDWIDVPSDGWHCLEDTNRSTPLAPSPRSKWRSVCISLMAVAGLVILLIKTKSGNTFVGKVSHVCVAVWSYIKAAMSKNSSY